MWDRRWAIGFSACLVLLAGLVSAFAQAAFLADNDLLKDGRRVEATVVERKIGTATRPSGWIAVEYSADRLRREKIFVAKPRAYEIGQRVVVLYDPEDPQRVRVPKSPNVRAWDGLPDWLATAAVSVLLFTLGLAIAWGNRDR